MGVSAVSGKVGEMAKLIDAGNCTDVESKPAENRYDRNWTGMRKLAGGAECPVYFWRRSSYSTTASEWILFDRFDAKSRDYLKLNPVRQKSIAVSLKRRTTDLNVVVQAGSRQSSLVVESIGNVNITISSYAAYKGDRGQGQVTMSLAGANWQQVARIDWDVYARRIVYTINGATVEEPKEFLELFSAFPLTEIMDRSIAMGYLSVP
ncbi:MAG: hypothetical protein HC902_01260 [Calothrix sp. SM1_5_4]|nr:hypothetical protein [Calothrix sp. SM1_5_4]